MIRLKDTAKFRIGFTFKNRIIDNPSIGSIEVLQPKDINEGELISSPAIIEAPVLKIFENHFLQAGELLLANKGTKFQTYIYKDKGRKSVAASSFFVITPNTDKLLPEYLQWYLTQPESIKHLLSFITGSTIPSINKAAVENLQLPLPSLSTQRGILEMIDTVKTEKEFLHQLINKRKSFLDSYIWEQIKEVRS